LQRGKIKRKKVNFMNNDLFYKNFNLICKNCKNEAKIIEKYNHDGLGNSCSTIILKCDFCEIEETITEITSYED
jgi:hypothetical protein